MARTMWAIARFERGKPVLLEQTFASTQHLAWARCKTSYSTDSEGNPGGFAVVNGIIDYAYGNKTFERYRAEGILKPVKIRLEILK